MSFAAVSLRRDPIVGHVVPARRLENPRFTKIETLSPRNHVHSFCFTSSAQIDEEVLSWLREAYRVGQQRHAFLMSSALLVTLIDLKKVEC